MAAGGLTMKMSAAVWIVALMALLTVPMKGTVAQVPECAMKLIGCAEFLNSTRPPSSCCDPLKVAMRDDFPCLCRVFSNQMLLTSFGIKISDAVTLPARCKIHKDISTCSKFLAPASAPASAPAPSTFTSPPPAATKSGSNSLMAVSWTATTSLLVFLISVMLN